MGGTSDHGRASACRRIIGRSVGIVVAIALIGACGHDGGVTVSSTGGSGASDTDPSGSDPIVTDGLTTADAIEFAAASAQAAIDLGDDLRSCPFEPVDAVFAAIPAHVPLAPGFTTSGVEAFGQVFSGGNADITYCEMLPVNFEREAIGEVRIDVAPGNPSLADYADEELGADEDELAPVDGFDGGSMHTWVSRSRSVAIWDADGILVAVLLSGEPVDAALAVDTLRAVLPVVLTNLAT